MINFSSNTNVKYHKFCINQSMSIVNKLLIIKLKMKFSYKVCKGSKTFIFKLFIGGFRFQNLYIPEYELEVCKTKRCILLCVVRVQLYTFKSNSSCVFFSFLTLKSLYHYINLTSL